MPEAPQPKEIAVSSHREPMPHEFLATALAQTVTISAWCRDAAKEIATPGMARPAPQVWRPKSTADPLPDVVSGLPQVNSEGRAQLGLPCRALPVIFFGNSAGILYMEVSISFSISRFCRGVG